MAGRCRLVTPVRVRTTPWSPEGLRTEIMAKILDLESISDRDSLVAQRVKTLPAMQETRV